MPERLAEMVWCPMNKAVTRQPSYQRECRAASDRCLNALSVVNDPTPAYLQVADLFENALQPILCHEAALSD